ncbi:hypothetical protein F4801DRAFT_599746 [Xylaria longipes]|nr:hypothetical protein F4801DRAFT_599746 [Xylaria longipes]RYC56728.1 hypothetical protein CHU98_g9483 [Xylaria longipes]
MEPGAHPTKRPRLTTPAAASWSNKLHGQAVSLPQPNPAHHPSVSGGPHHAPPPAQYQPPPSFSRPPEPPLPPAHHQSLDDHRHHHHDHELYPPIQDTPRQLPPSPAHPPYPSYPTRDPIVKRDVGEEQALPQLRRPSSTGHTVDGLPPTPHGPPHPAQHHPEDPRRHMNFDNGASMPHSPALYRPPSLPQGYHPPPPPPASQQPQHYEGPHGGYGPPPPMYPALEIQNASAKRKAQRASQACDNCRQLKAKCDETKPCKNCREKNVECKYRDPPAKQPDKMSSDILDMLSEVKKSIKSLDAKIDQFDRVESRLANLENMVMHGNPDVAKMKLESIEEDDRPDPQQSSVSDARDMPEEEATEVSTPGRTSVVEAPLLSLEDARETLRLGEYDNIEAEPGPTVPPGRPAIPPNHTTLASLLLTWPSIYNMVHHILMAEGIRYVEEYPIRQEQQRGVLRLFGRGEGPDSDTRTFDKGTPQDVSSTDRDDASEVAGPTPGPDIWGQVGGLTPGPGVDYKGGALNSDGNPDWDPGRIWKYVGSFKEHILNMHPIIIPKELDAMVRVFLEQLPKSSNTPSNKAGNFSAGFIQPAPNPPSAMPEIGSKRKRSPAGDELSPIMSFRKPGRPYRNVQSALVLMVLALGKICLHKGNIPEVIHEPDDFTSNSPMVRNGVLASPGQGSPGQFAPSQSSGLPSPKEHERTVMMSRRSSMQGNLPFNRPSSTHKRNIDVIPGLEYFALASDIMGGDYGGFCLRHVYVHILAGLYHGQLGRVLESWEHISTASRKLQVVLRPSLGRLSQLSQCSPESRRDNQLSFAFWTCLQLESDILAELQLPQSGILAYESQMPYPNGVFAEKHGFSMDVVQSYVAQLYLRKQLNRVHNLLYNPNPEHRRHYQTMDDEINEIQAVLGGARDTWVPPSFRWNDDDPPPKDILAARLRAKYWGSQVILYRPFLKRILNAEAQTPLTYQNEHAPPDTTVPPSINEKNSKEHNPRTIQNARLAIRALIESTRAFHGIDTGQHRIIITNIFGTAHAQWGNLLTLAACYKNETLRSCISAEELSSLFSRTIRFFATFAQPSSALKLDMNILMGLAKELGFTPDEMDVRADSSFSSTTSSAVVHPMHPTTNNYHFHGASSPSMMRTY